MTTIMPMPMPMPTPVPAPLATPVAVPVAGRKAAPAVTPATMPFPRPAPMPVPPERRRCRRRASALLTDDLVRPADHQARREAERLCAGGLLTRLVGDVYAPSHLPVTAVLRAAAAWALLPDRAVADDAVVGLRAAAWIHLGDDGGVRAPDRVELLWPQGRDRLHDPVAVLQVDVPPAHVVRRRAARVTSPARTAVDLARLLPGDRALPLLHALALLTDADEVDVVLSGMRRCRGLQQARRLLAMMPPGPQTACPAHSMPRDPVMR